METENPTGENHGSESMGGNGQGSGNTQSTPPKINPEHRTSAQDEDARETKSDAKTGPAEEK